MKFMTNCPAAASIVNKEKSLADPVLGDVIFRKNVRAKRYIISFSRGKVRVTIPYLGSYAKAEEFFRENREVLIRRKQSMPAKPVPKYDEAELRKEAKAILPAKLLQLSVSHCFRYKEVKIRKSRTRWGSCSVKGVISLSIFLMLLPDHLIEYVLLHELCHTVQPNHSAAFWTLLNEHTGGKAEELRRELKQFNTFSYS